MYNFFGKKKNRWKDEQNPKILQVEKIIMKRFKQSWDPVFR